MEKRREGNHIKQNNDTNNTENHYYQDCLPVDWGCSVENYQPELPGLEYWAVGAIVDFRKKRLASKNSKKAEECVEQNPEKRDLLSQKSSLESEITKLEDKFDKYDDCGVDTSFVTRELEEKRQKLEKTENLLRSFDD